ncbi:MAG: hypothetical protein AAB484_01495 [Patescibacteria group bacterium]
MNLTKRITFSGLVMGLGLALMSSVVLAQTETITETTATTDIPQELTSLARDLGCQTTAQCAEKFDANIEQGITLAQKYDIYTPEQEKIAVAFKTEVLERLRTVSGDNFDQEILALANKILSEKPALASTMGVTRQTVNTAETIINTVRDAGVDMKTCRKSPENLSREELIACVKASSDLSNKEKLVGDYIPKENAKAREVERMLDLENSLLAGEYSGLGKINVEQAGQVCLKSGSESITDCDRIAEKFFGAEGVKNLRDARQQTTLIKEYYTEGIKKMELLTPDGQKLIGKGAIKNACDRAFEESNLGLARACGNFAVKNGYATQREIEDGLKLLESFSQKARGVNFDDCRFNPESCREFLPDEFRREFDYQSEIFKVMSESIGFDPSRCENTYNSDISKQCLEGAKKSLSRIEEIAKNSPGARKIVNEIKGHITEGERMTERLNEYNQDSRSAGIAGPGGCRGPEECFKYCNQPANGAECIAFGAKSQIFDQSTVAQKFNNLNERFTDPRFNQYPQNPQYPYQPQQPVGPSPECLAAISSGDFAKAKTACANTTNTYERYYPQPVPQPFPICPAYSMPSPCPEGQMRQQTSDTRGCPTSGACIAIENYRPIDTTKCPMMPTVSSCPAEQEKYETYRSNECGVYYSCRDITARQACPSGQYWDGRSCVTQTPTIVGSCNYSTQYWKSSTSQCQPRTNCYDTANSEYNSMECQGVRGMTTNTSSCPMAQYWNGTACVNSTTVSGGCSSPSAQTQSACLATPECNWFNNACSPTTSNPQSCPSGQYWNGSACVNSGSGGCGSYTNQASCVSASQTCNWNTSGSNGWCQQATAVSSCGNYICESGETTSCPNDCRSYTSCPPGQYWYTPPSGGTGYCMSSTSGTVCSSGQYWNGTACVANTTTSTDPSAGCAQAGGTWNSSTSYCQMPNMTGNTSCSSGQYWSGTACVTSSPTTGQCSTDHYWNGTACQSNTMPSSNTTMPSSSGTACSSGQYWNGTACVSSTPSDTSGTYTAPSGGGGTYTPPSGSGTYTPPSASLYCSQIGGSWTGAACNLAKNISKQKAYYSYFQQKESDLLLAQVGRAFANLFR